MPILVRLSHVISYAAIEYQNELENYHTYGLQQSWASVCRFHYDITEAIAEMTVCRFCETCSLKVS